MDWKFNTKTNTHECNFNGYGYTIINIIEPCKETLFKITGYSLYFHNGWRTERPLGEYITRDGKTSSVFSETSEGLAKKLIFNTVEEAKTAAEKHQAKGEEPTSYEDDLFEDD